MSKGKKGKKEKKKEKKEKQEKKERKAKKQEAKAKPAPKAQAKPAPKAQAKPAPKAQAKPAPAPKAQAKPAPQTKAPATAPAAGAKPAKAPRKGRGKEKLPEDPQLLAKALARKARIAAAKAQKKNRSPEPEEDEEEDEEGEGDEDGALEEDYEEEEGEEGDEELPEGGGDLDQREVLLHDALRAQRQRDFAAAERYVTRFIELYPDDLRGPVHLGNMKRARGDREGALEAYRTALRRDRDNPLALWSKADYHLSDPVSPDIGEAQAALQRIVQVCGRKRDDASHKWAEQARDKLRYCESRKFSLESRRFLAKTPPPQKNLEKARDLLAKALQVYPADPRNHMNLGSVLLQLGQAEKAIERCREAIRIHPGYARAHLILGYAHRRLGQLRQAKDAFLQCIELDRQQRDVAEAWKARREVEQELARFRRRFYVALSAKPGEEGESEPLDLSRLKEWVTLLEGDPVEAADLALDPRGAGYVLTAFGQRSTYKAWPGPEGLVLERQ